jgi:Fe-S-cluster containining protein
MDIKAKTKKLLSLYGEFDEKARPYREAAVCSPGCADCCINVGNVDAITLEGWIILERMRTMDPGRRSRLNQALTDNARTKPEATYARCPFLLDNLRCGIYPVRPFSCRRLYSLAPCGESGPTVHRQVWTLAEETVAAIQELDDTGFSGHLSHILLLLQDPDCRRIYQNGEFAPDAIRPFEFARHLFINRRQTRK